MMQNIDINQMNRLMEESEEAKQIISIHHRSRNPQSADSGFFRSSDHSGPASGSKRVCSLESDHG